MVRNVYVMVRKKIMGVLRPLFDSDYEPSFDNINPEAYRNASRVRTLMRFNPGQLFKGHKGCIYSVDNAIVMHNTYFSGSINQHIDRNGIKLAMQHTINHPIWLYEKLKSVHTILKTLQYENMPIHSQDFLLIDNNDRYRLTPECAFISSKQNLDMNEAYSHYDSIQYLKRLNKSYSYLKRNLKDMSVSELVNMFSSLHKKLNNHWVIPQQLIS